MPLELWHEPQESFWSPNASNPIGVPNDTILNVVNPVIVREATFYFPPYMIPILAGGHSLYTVMLEAITAGKAEGQASTRPLFSGDVDASFS